jgi:hypothetical protein
LLIKAGKQKNIVNAGGNAEKTNNNNKLDTSQVAAHHCYILALLGSGI